MLQPLIISAPFGNYIQPAGCTPTLGTFTAARRRGRLWRILKTVRRDRKRGAWVNKIGLRNPGVGWLASRVASGRVDVSDKLVSIHGFDDADWRVLLDQVEAMRPMGVELNMSCPNVGEAVGESWPGWLFAEAVSGLRGRDMPTEVGTPGGGSEVIVKLPPVRYEAMAEAAYEAGVRTFHCCNTIPVERGGESGKPLMPLSLACIRDLRGRFGDDMTLIGGGGITDPSDIDHYVEAGADRFALGTVTMNPMLLLSHRSLQPLIERAAEVVGAATT